MEDMGTEEKLDRINDSLRKLVGAINAASTGKEEGPLMVKLAIVEADVKHLQVAMKDIKTALWGLAGGVLGLVIKMVMEGVMLK